MKKDEILEMSRKENAGKHDEREMAAFGTASRVGMLVGGILCAIGQILIDKTKLTPARILVFYVVAGVILGGTGLYEKLVEFAGAGATVPLTGFGHALAKGVEKAVAENIVDYVAMDIKNPPELYAKTVGLERLDMEAIERSKNFLLEGRVDYEFRTTVVKPLHDTASVQAMARWLEQLGDGQKIRRFFLQPFVDRDTVLFTGLSRPNDAQLSEFVGCLSAFSAHSAVRG